jgi:hypothetical protein
VPLPLPPTPTPPATMAPLIPPTRKQTIPPPLAPMPPRRDIAPARISGQMAAPHMVVDKPSIGAAYLQRKTPSRLACLVALALALAVIGLIAYIVVK